MKTVLKFLIRVYQLFGGAVKWLMGGQSGASCRFTPSCSEYAAEALEMHGAWKGSVLAAKRICKCHPWGTYGYDPVPPSESEIRNSKFIWDFKQYFKTKSSEC